jgi:hypothetical protein
MISKKTATIFSMILKSDGRFCFLKHKKRADFLKNLLFDR